MTQYSSPWRSALLTALLILALLLVACSIQTDGSSGGDTGAGSGDTSGDAASDSSSGDDGSGSDSGSDTSGSQNALTEAQAQEAAEALMDSGSDAAGGQGLSAREPISVGILCNTQTQYASGELTFSSTALTLTALLALDACDLVQDLYFTGTLAFSFVDTFDPGTIEASITGTLTVEEPDGEGFLQPLEGDCVVDIYSDATYDEVDPDGTIPVTGTFCGVDVNPPPDTPPDPSQ